MSLPFRWRFSVLVSDKPIGWCVLVIGALLLAVTLQAEAPANSPTKPGKLPKDIVPRSSDLFAATGTLTKPPAARTEVVHDTYFGETVDDPYRWMENDKDPAWLEFLKAQNDYTRAVLDKLPGRDALLKRIQQLSGDTVQTNRLQRAGGKLFFQQRPLGADNFKLFVREAGHDRVLVDPTKLSSGSSHFSLDWWRASPDGTHVVYGWSKDGSEDSLLHVLTVSDGKDLPEHIENTQMANPQWLDDGSGFFYNQLTNKVGTPERFLDSQARFHRLGADPASDPILMKRGLVPGVDYDRIQAPFIQTYPGAHHVLLVLTDVRPEVRLLIAPLEDALAGHASWKSIAGFDDELTGFEMVGDDLYLLVNKGTPRGRLLKTNTAKPEIATATEVVPQGSLVIDEIKRAKDGLYLKMMDGGIHRLRRVDWNGHVADIALPFDGNRRSIHGRERRWRAHSSLRLAHANRRLVGRCHWQTRRHRHYAKAAHRRERLRDETLLCHSQRRRENSL
jgi:prolyl oligopeptidase